MDVLPSRVFMNGNSQAVRIPAEFRLSTDHVQISRTPQGDLLIHPCPMRRGETTMQKLDGLRRLVPVVYPEGDAVCRHYAEQAANLKSLGTPIGANNLWIACHALAIGATVVSHNLREFRRIAGLQLVDWAES